MTDKKNLRPVRAASSVTGKSPIAAPPRAATGGRSRAEQYDDSASLKSVKSTADTNASEEVDDESLLLVKDARIAHLEKEIVTMEDEFQRELTVHSERLTEANEAVHHWQQKHLALNEAFLKADLDLRQFNENLKSWEEKNEERNRDVITRISTLMSDRDGLREAYTKAIGDLGGKDDTIKALQSQVWGLKSFVSQSSKMDEQVTDEALGERLQKIANSLQNWVITSFRRVKLDVHRADEKAQEELLQLVPTYEQLASSSKIHFIQSLISRILVKFVFDEYFVGLAKEQADDMIKVENDLGKICSVESMNQWRSTTLTLVHKEASQALQSQTAATIHAVLDLVSRIVASISDYQGVVSSDQSLRTLIIDAIDLARLLRVQKAVFSVVMPTIEAYQRTRFNPDIMDDVGGEDEELLLERELRCVIFPGIEKAGDENGEKGHLRNIIAKIRVLCAPD